MARTASTLPAGSRITDFVTVGVIARTFPLAKVRQVLAETGKTSQRERELPAHVVVYYVITLALFMNASCREVLRCPLEGVQWLSGGAPPLKITTKGGISQARSRLGFEVMQRIRHERPTFRSRARSAMIVQSLSWRGMRWAETMMSMVISTVLNAYKLDLGLGAALR